MHCMLSFSMKAFKELIYCKAFVSEKYEHTTFPKFSKYGKTMSWMDFVCEGCTVLLQTSYREQRHCSCKKRLALKHCYEMNIFQKLTLLHHNLSVWCNFMPAKNCRCGAKVNVWYIWMLWNIFHYWWHRHSLLIKIWKCLWLAKYVYLVI